MVCVCTVAIDLATLVALLCVLDLCCDSGVVLFCWNFDLWLVFDLVCSWCFLLFWFAL